MRTPSLMSAKSLAHLHAAVVVEELRRCGVGVFCLSPGARAIPLVLALEEQPAVVTKLADRGSFQAAGLVTDAELFLRELAEVLA